MSNTTTPFSVVSNSGHENWYWMRKFIPVQPDTDDWVEIPFDTPFAFIDLVQNIEPTFVTSGATVYVGPSLNYTILPDTVASGALVNAPILQAAGITPTTVVSGATVYGASLLQTAVVNESATWLDADNDPQGPVIVGIWKEASDGQLLGDS